MYTPPAFRLEDTSRALEIAAAYPFGVFAALLDGEIEVTHLPMKLSETPAGLRLIGHVAKANPLVKSITAGATGTAVFSGPHAYISPDWYAEGNLVPTWNYVAVHVSGPLLPITDDEALKDLLAALTLPQETDLAPKPAWTHGKMPEDLLGRMLKGIVGFEMRVETLTAKTKLSQNRSKADIAGAIEGLEARGGAGDIATAALMREML
jgi:transcriptional regulator